MNEKLTTPVSDHVAEGAAKEAFTNANNPIESSVTASVKLEKDKSGDVVGATLKIDVNF